MTEVEIGFLLIVETRIQRNIICKILFQLCSLFILFYFALRPVTYEKFTKKNPL